MSIKVMSHVWANSKQKGASLLLLLAMADMADENGDCYPSTDYLARKSRSNERNVQRTINRLIEEGELIVFEKQGMPGKRGQKTNLYRLVLTTIEAAIAIPVPQRGGKNATTNDRKIKVRKKEVVKTPPPTLPQVVAKTPPDPFTDPSVKDQKQKEVVVARPRTPLTLFSEGAIWMLSRTGAARPQPVEAIQPAAEPTDEEFVLDLFEGYFGKRNLPAKEQVRAAIAQYGLAAVRNALEEAKATNRSGVVFWSYVEVIADRHYQRQLDQQPAGMHDQLLGMRRGYQAESPEDAMIYTHPLWQVFRDHWQVKTSVAPNIPPLSVKRYADCARALDRLKVTPEQITRLVDRMLAKRRTGYKFEFAAGDITEILTEDALSSQQRDPALITAICKVWKVAAGEFTNGIADILLSMEKPSTADEVLKFGAWYAAQPQFKTQAKPPTTFDALTLRVNEFRATQRPSVSSSPSTTFTPLPRSAPISAEERKRIREEVLARQQQPEGALS